MITTRAVPAPLPTHNRRVATSPSVMKDFADPLGPGQVPRFASREGQLLIELVTVVSGSILPAMSCPLTD